MQHGAEKHHWRPRTAATSYQTEETNNQGQAGVVLGFMAIFAKMMAAAMSNYNQNQQPDPGERVSESAGVASNSTSQPTKKPICQAELETEKFQNSSQGE